MAALARRAIGIDVRMAIAELHADYAACLDQRHFDEWPAFFTEECVYRLQPRENHDRGLPLATMAFESKGMLRDRVHAVTQTLFHVPYATRHVVGFPRVWIEGGDESDGVAGVDADGDADGDGGAGASADGDGDAGEVYGAESNYVVIRVRENEMPEVFNAGRYLDRIVRERGQLRFRERLAIFDSALIANSIIYPI